MPKHKNKKIKGKSFKRSTYNISRRNLLLGGLGIIGLVSVLINEPKFNSKSNKMPNKRAIKNISNEELASWLFSLPRDISIRIFNSALKEVADLELFSEWGKVILEAKMETVYDSQIEMNNAYYNWFDNKIHMGKMNPISIVNFMLEKGLDEGRSAHFHEHLHALQHRNSKYYSFMKFLNKCGVEYKVDFVSKNASKKLDWKLSVTPEILTAFSKDYLNASTDEKTIIKIFRKLCEEVNLYVLNSITLFESHSYIATKQLSKKDLIDILKLEKYSVKSERQIENCWYLVNAAYSLYDEPNSAEAHMQVAALVGKHANIYDSKRETYPSLEEEIDKIAEKKGIGKNYVANFDESLSEKRYAKLEETQTEVKRKVREKLLEEYAFIKGF